MKQTARQDVSHQLEDLSHLGAKALRAKWESLYGRSPPSRIGAPLLRLAIAYRIREIAFGGLPAATKQLIAKLAIEMDEASEQPRSSQRCSRPARREDPPLPVGTQLLREWKGAIVIVDVVPDGFSWRGQRFASLSAVAMAITGTSWSGPRFFGLRRKRGAAQLTPTTLMNSIKRELIS